MFTKVILGLVAAFVAIVFHEFGHMLAALAAGGRFSFVAVGPILAARTPAGRIRIGWNRSLHLMGGAALVLPTRTENIRTRFAWVLACGPLASLFLALGADMILRFSAPAQMARIELQWLRLISGCLCVATLLPLPNGPWISDGQRLARVLSSGPHGRRELALVTLAALEAQGVPPKSWDPSLLADGLKVRDGSMFECQMHIWSFRQARDTGDAERSTASLANAMALAPRMPSVLRDECLRLQQEQLGHAADTPC